MGRQKDHSLAHDKYTWRMGLTTIPYGMQWRTEREVGLLIKTLVIVGASMR